MLTNLFLFYTKSYAPALNTMLEPKYVKDISSTYRPYVFKSRNALRRLLLGKILLNMSSVALSDVEIETLALALWNKVESIWREYANEADFWQELNKEI